jgi:hypothetical protein
MNQELQNRLSRLIQKNVNDFSMPLELAIDSAFNDIYGMPDNPPDNRSSEVDDSGEFGASFN